MGLYLENYTLPHIRAELNAVLEAAMFKPLNKAEWVRYWGWKSDHIYITRDTRRSFSFNCVAWAAPWTENEKTEFDNSFDIVTLPWIIGKPGGEFKVPFWPSSIERFRSEIIRSFKNDALRWFDRFQTPKMSLAAARANQTMAKDSPAFQGLAEYVASLPPELDNMACLSYPAGPIHDERRRRLFLPPSQRKSKRR
jgi:hypothetical protein